MSAALTMFLTACDNQPKKSKLPVRPDDGMFVMDDFESGALTEWQAVSAGSGGWFIYTNGQKAADPAQSDPTFRLTYQIRPRASSRR